jgi:hypothetical protein
MTEGATPRVLLTQLALAGPEAAHALARPALEEARRAEPERAEVHRLLGRLRLLEGAAREEVLDAWRRGRALDPATPLPPAWLEEARRRLGGGEDLDALAR